MKVTTQHATNLVQGEVESVEMTLSKRGIAQATRMFRDQIYTHKEWAVVREIIANAIDEHTKHGIQRPVTVSLPTYTDPHFKVRDYAKGLSKEMVFSVFFQYFESTKSESHDDIGGFGIGAKSPLAYANMFFVDSYFGGQKTSYAANINGQVSTAHKMDLQDTTETGIEVSVPVESKDFALFGALVGELIHFSGWDVEVLNDSLLKKPESVWKYESETGKVGHPNSRFSSTSSVYACIKGILYAVDRHDEIVNPFYNFTILNFDGSDEIEINPSRERIELTKRNIVKINNALQSLRQEIVLDISEKTKGAKTARDLFDIKTDTSCLRSADGLEKTISKSMYVKNGFTFFSWDGLSSFDRKKKSDFFEGFVHGLDFSPNGLYNVSNHWKKRACIEKGSVILWPSDESVRSEYVIAFAEKKGIPSPVFVVSADVPDSWVKDSDYFEYTPDCVSKEEAKAIRDIYSPRTSGSRSAGFVRTKEKAIMGYYDNYRARINMVEFSIIKENKNKFILVPSNTQNTYAILDVLRNNTKHTILVVWDSHLKAWKNSGLNYELYDQNKFKNLCQSLLNNELNIETKNGLKTEWVLYRKNKETYIPSKRINANTKGCIEVLFPDLKPETCKEIQKAWEKAQDRFDNLSILQKESIIYVFEQSFYRTSLKTIEAIGKKALDKVFV